MAEKVEIPDELKVLCPELQKQVIVIGSDGYMLYPLTEGQAERLSGLITDIMTDIMTTDLKCPKCGEVYPGSLGKKEFCNKCKGKIRLESAQKSPIEALTYQDRIPIMIEEMVGVPATDVKNSLTIPQFKHIAGVLYGQNFKDDGVVPDESKKNFKEMMKWIGMGPKNEMEKVVKADILESEKSTNHSHMSMDSQENTSKENGKQGKVGKES